MNANNPDSTIHGANFLKLIFKFQNNFKPNSFVLYLGTILKLLGLIMLTHSLDIIVYDNKKYSISDFIKKITMCNKGNYHNYLNQIDYGCICFFFYILLPIPWVILYMIHRYQSKDNYKSTKALRVLLKFASLYNQLILLFTQHIIELLSLVIFFLIKAPSEQSKDNNSGLSKDSILTSNIKYFYLIMNCIYIIGLNLYTFLQVSLLNQPFFSAKVTIQIYENRWFQIILCLLFNCQGISLTQIFYPKDSLLKLIIACVLIAVLFVYYCSYANSFFSEQTILSKIFILIINMSFLSCLLEIYVYNSKMDGMTVTEFIEKILIEFVFAIIIDVYLSFLIVKKLRHTMSKRIFAQQKNSVAIESLLYFTTILMKSVEDNTKIYDIILMIQDHKKECKETTCQCNKSSFRLRYERLSNIKTEVHSTLTIDQFYLVYKEIIICFENEINKAMDILTKTNKLLSNTQVILLQIEFICFFSQNVFFSCFLIEKYLRKIRHPTFMLQYQLYQLKHKAIQSYKNQLYENLYRFGKSHSKEMMTFSHFFKYQQIIWSIRKYLNIASSDYLNVFSLKHMKHSIAPNSLNEQCNIEQIIQHCKRYSKSSRELRHSITRNFSFHTKLNNEELCYLITMYYLTICREMPKCIQKCTNVEYTSVDFIQSKLESYSEKGMNHPIIVFVEEGKEFVIRYMCKYLMASLGYDRNELIGREINILLPNEFNENHLAVISTTILKKKPKYFEDNVFCIDKKGYYMPIRTAVGFFPSIQNNIIVIINVIYRSYSPTDSFIVMDEYGTFLTYSKTFENNFIINREIINKVKFNFFNFFNMNEGTLDPFRRILNEINTTKKKEAIEKGSIQRDTMIKFSNKKGDKINDKLKEVNEIPIIYDKQRLKTSLEKIKNWIKESQTDLSLLYRIEEHEKTFDLFRSTSNLRDNSMNMINKYKKQLMVMQIKMSSMNNSPFYYVKIYDIEHSSQDFLNKSMNNFSVISSNLNKKDDGLIGHVKTWMKPCIKTSNTVMPMSPLKPKRNSLIRKLLQNPGNYGIGQANPNASNINNSSLVNLNNTNTNQSLVQLNKKALFNIKNKAQLIKKSTAKRNSISMSHPNDHKGKSEHSRSKTLNGYIKSFTISNGLFNKNRFDCQNILIYKIIMIFAIFLLTFLSIFFYPLIGNMIDQLEQYSLLANSNEILQYLLTSSSLLTINSCLIISHKDPNTIASLRPIDIKMKLQMKSKELLEHLNIFHSAINTLNAYHLIDIPRNTYSVIKQDWNTYNRNSSLIDELLSYHFYLDSASRQDKGISQCHMEAFKYKKFATKPVSFPFDINNDDVLLYYIIENIINRIIPNLVEVYSLIANDQSGHFASLKIILIVYTTCFLLFLLLLVIFLTVLFTLFIKSNLEMTQRLVSEKNDGIIVTRLMMFKVIIEEFDYEKCEEYERVMKSSSALVRNETYYANRDSEMMSLLKNQMFNSNLNVNPSGSDINGIKHITQQSFVKGYNNKHLTSNYYYSTNDYMNDMGVFASIGNNANVEQGEMIIGLNPHLAPNAKKKEENDDTTDPGNASTNDNQIHTEENLMKILHKNNHTVFIFRIFILIFLIISIGLLLVFLFINLNNSHLLQKSNSIISSHLSIMTSYNYLTLFYLTNVLYFNPYPFPLQDPTYKSFIQNNWYNIKPDINNTIISNYKDTMYSAILYLLAIAEGNVKTFSSIETSLLAELKTIDHQFDSKDCCLISSLKYNEITLVDIDLLNYFLIVSKSAERCRVLGNGLNDNGLPTALQTYLLELNSIYKDFISDYNNNEHSRYDYYFFLNQPAIFDSIINILFQGDKVQLVLSNIGKSEVMKTIAQWRTTEVYFILGFVLFDLIFIGITLWILIKLKRDYNTLLKIVTIITTSLQSSS